MALVISNGFLELDEVFAPDQAVNPDGSMIVVIRARTHNFAFRDPPQEDFCGAQENPCDQQDIGSTKGICTKGVINIDTSEYESDPVCLNFPLPGDSQTIDIEVTLPVPNREGSHQVSGFLRTSGTEQETDSINDSITVSSTAPEEPEDPTNGGDGDNGNGGGGDLLQTIIRNPGKAAVVGLGGVVVVNQLTGK